MSAGTFVKLNMTGGGEKHDSPTFSWFDDNGTVLNYTSRTR